MVSVMVEAPTHRVVNFSVSTIWRSRFLHAKELQRRGNCQYRLGLGRYGSRARGVVVSVIGYSGELRLDSST
jgi:hypothetical protein